MLAATVPAGVEDTPPSVYSPTPDFVQAIRGQSPMYEMPPAVAPTVQQLVAPPVIPVNQPSLWNPMGTAGGFDPFLSPPGAVAPGMAAGGVQTGLNGPQPYRFGWTSRGDLTFLPAEGTGTPMGSMEITGIDASLQYTAPVAPSWLFSFTQEFGTRFWQGPSGPIGLPGTVYRVGWDLELATPSNGPVSMQLGFNPSLNSDFETSPGSDAWNLDGRAMLFFRNSPHLMWVLGAGYWDRVDDMVIPYAGLVFTPNDLWEWRLLFPEARISYFLGNIHGYNKWIYANFEYHVESYEIDRQPGNLTEQIQLEDYRILLGLRMESGPVVTFIEGGWVFGREVSFGGSTPGFDIDTGFIGRVGVRF